MQIRVQRRFLGPDYTVGSLFINGVKLCDTMEDTVRTDGVKIPNRTAIPYGTYWVELTMSPKFTRLLPLVLDVPNFVGIRIHRGNTAEDSSGCILPGENKVKGKVINSTEYEMKIVTKMLEAIRNGEEISLEIV